VAEFMKAAVYHQKHDLKVEEVPVREPKGNEVLIRIKYCGVCGTDLHIYNGDDGSAPVTPPLIPGHEFSGVVEKVGSEVKTIKVGDRVSADPNDMCGECYFCRNGREHFCRNHIGIGTTLDGAFAEYMTIREKQVYPFSDRLSFEEAAMAEPVSCCLHAIDLCGIEVGDTVLVIGGGPIGLIMLQLARQAGAAQVILSEPVAEKRELAKRLGADLVVDPVNENLEEILKGCCENVDQVIECVGNPKTEVQAIECAGRGAVVMLFGLTDPGAEINIKPYQLFKKELKLTASFINPYTFERALKLLESGRIDVRSIITDIVSLDEIGKVFSDSAYRRRGKVMIRIG